MYFSFQTRPFFEMTNSVRQDVQAAWLWVIVVAVGVVVGCESDPLLAPQQESEQGGGSYGLIYFDPEGDDGKKQKDDGDTSRTRNTERF